jgi:RNA polymerase sigma-70 factor, ECF subfamily
MDPRTDEQLVGAYLEGEESSFEELAERYLRPVFYFIRHYVVDANEAEDLVQQTFLNAWKHLRSFDRTRSFKTWVLSVARNAAFDHLRKKKTVPFSEFDDDTGGNWLVETRADGGARPEEMAERKELERALEEALAKMPAHDRAVFSLRLREDLTFQGIADVLGEPIDTVKSRYHRGLERLRRFIGPDGDAPKSLGGA